jgi:hypothetical protein
MGKNGKGNKGNKDIKMSLSEFNTSGLSRSAVQQTVTPGTQSDNKSPTVPTIHPRLSAVPKTDTPGNQEQKKTGGGRTEKQQEKRNKRRENRKAYNDKWIIQFVCYVLKEYAPVELGHGGTNWQTWTPEFPHIATTSGHPLNDIPSLLLNKTDEQMNTVFTMVCFVAERDRIINEWKTVCALGKDDENKRVSLQNKIDALYKQFTKPNIPDTQHPDMRMANAWIAHEKADRAQERLVFDQAREQKQLVREQARKQKQLAREQANREWELQYARNESMQRKREAREAETDPEYLNLVAKALLDADKRVTEDGVYPGPGACIAIASYGERNKDSCEYKPPTEGHVHHPGMFVTRTEDGQYIPTPWHDGTTTYLSPAELDA